MRNFTLTHLTYAGSGKPTAQVIFSPTFTLIYGSSDTGKTFIVNSIDYMLGGHVAPSIPRARGYSQILLGLQLSDGSPVTLVRRPGSNRIHVHHADLRDLAHAPADTVLSARRTRSGHDISHRLLSYLGMEGSYIRTSEEGNTDILKITDLAHLSLVTDSRMVSSTPPSQRVRNSTAKTISRSVMRLLLTGEEEPPASRVPNAAQRRVQRGQISLIDQLVIELTAKLTAQENESELGRRLSRLNGTLEELTRSLREETSRQTETVAARTQLAAAQSEIATRLGEISDLLGRFGILRQQYESDLARLEMVSEAGNLLGYFQVGRCVFCGADPEHQHPQHGIEESTHLHDAVIAENSKTHALLADLKLTIADLETQREELTQRYALALSHSQELDLAIERLEAGLLPVNARLDQVLTERSEVERNLEVLARIGELDERRTELVSTGALPSKRSEPFTPARAVTSFDAVLQRTLDAWHVPDTANASYDPYGGDIRAGGSFRADRGAGMRALLHAAFSTALARYCLDRELPHPGFIVFDSPLVTYREPDHDEDDYIPPDVNDHFYRHFLDFPCQTIIVENSAPPPDVVEQAHVIHFRRGSNRRAGFFPPLDDDHEADDAGTTEETHPRLE
ncbi:hypothetical protein [Streptomyces tropicalis]|uniref:Rad50/SbcC-type AAA domain-containing protein n=1 Tax=Streptomyces tropicalis TaxID=3034234 RepID=A0ABT6A8C7_9ACTN|nr:hypothetical protein [Streptomyces tropicalis]MDF3300902.1 hypothetical protein [Streptomyces tropicalis]